MIHLDYYTTLGVSPNASDEDIKKSYRKLVFQFHPDRNDSKEAEAKIREINAAYAVLGDPQTRKSYERLRFGGSATSQRDYGGVAEERIDPSVILQEMEKKLWDEARKELFPVLMKDLSRIKEELARIREDTVTNQGYDTFREDLVKKRGAVFVTECLNQEMEDRKQRLLDVAVQMMVSQGVGTQGKQDGENWVQEQLTKAYDGGRLAAYCEACELLYARR